MFKRIISKRYFSLENLTENNFTKINHFEQLIKKLENIDQNLNGKEIKKNYNKLENFLDGRSLLNNIISNNPKILINEKNKIFLDNANKFFYNYNLNDDEKKMCLYSLNNYFINDYELLNNKIEILKNKFDFDNDSILSLIKNYPEAMNFEEAKLLETKLIIQNFADINDEDYKKLLKKWPFYLNFNNEKLIRNLDIFIKNLPSYKSLEFMLKNFPFPLIFSMGNFVSFYQYILKYFFKNKSEIEELKNVIEKHPSLLIQNIKYGTKEKVDYLQKELKYSTNDIKFLILYYPDSFSKSLNNWKTKVDYLQKRHFFDIVSEVSFPELIKYDYLDLIRPRGELMILNEKKIPWEKVILMNDKEFCKNLNIDIELLENKKKELVDNRILINFDKQKSEYWKYMSMDLKKKFEEYIV